MTTAPASRLAALLLALLLAAPVHAQLYLGLDVQGGLPQNDFGDHLDDVGFGIAGFGLYHLDPLPLALGVEGGLLTYGKQARALPAQLGAAGATLGEIETVNRISHLHAVLRLQPATGALRPYLDGIAGFNYLYTRSAFDQTVIVVGDDVDLFSLDLTDAAVYEQRTTSTNLDDFALSYGVGAGVLVQIAAGEDEGLPWEAFLDLGARYLFGEDASYLQEGAVLEPGVPVLRPVQTATDLLRPQLGLVVRLGR